MILLVGQNICGQDSLKFRAIDSLIAQKEKQISSMPSIRVNADGFGLGDSYGEIFLADSISKELSKVEYDKMEVTRMNHRYIKIIFYFDKNELIKVIVIDESIRPTFPVDSYFKNNKMIYTNHKSTEEDYGEVFLLNKSQKYLKRYLEYQAKIYR